MPNIENYYTEAISAGVITMLERPEIVSGMKDRILNF